MIHQIKTIYGVSEITYGGEELGDWENYPRGGRHILQCKSNSMQKLHVELLTEMKNWMTKVQTHPEILYFPYEGLQSWFQKGEYNIDHNMEPHIKNTCRTQALLGWESLLHIFLSINLMQYQ